MLEVGLRMAGFKARHNALAVLTPEQRKKGKAAHEKRMREMMSGRHVGAVSGGHESAKETRQRHGGEPRAVTMQ